VLSLWGGVGGGKVPIASQEKRLIGRTQGTMPKQRPKKKVVNQELKVTQQKQEEKRKEMAIGRQKAIKERGWQGEKVVAIGRGGANVKQQSKKEQKVAGQRKSARRESRQSCPHRRDARGARKRKRSAG